MQKSSEIREFAGIIRKLTSTAKFQKICPKKAGASNRSGGTSGALCTVCQMQRHPSSPPSRFAALTSQPRGPQPGARLQAAALGSTAAVSSPGPLFLLGTRALSQKFLPSSDAGSFHPLFTRQHRHSTLPWQQQQQRQQQKRSHPCKVKRAPRVVIMIWTVLVHTLHVNSNSSSVQVSQRLHCPSHPQKQTCLQVWTRF